MTVNPNQSGLGLYRFFLRLLFPAVGFYTLYRAFKDGGKTYFFQRFGFDLPQKKEHLWLHCASVGEINTATPLIELLLKQHYKLLISTTTPTGKTVLQLKHSLNTNHVFMPLDYGFCIKRFLHKIQPRALLILETEIWPELIHLSQQRQIPILLINARLSERTTHSFSWLRRAYAQALSQLTMVYARSTQDGEKYVALGLPTDKLLVLGSLKYAVSHITDLTPPLLQSDYWLAASTHEDEELQIAQAWLKRNRPELLVIAPRHPERRNAIKRDLQSLTPQIQLRSESGELKANTRIYLTDTLGELKPFITNSRFVFMGGSLIARGGHNPMEAAHAGVATLSGPYRENFEEEFSELASVQACHFINNAEELIDRVCFLLDHPTESNAMGRRARKLAQTKSKVGLDYLQAIEKIIGPA